MNFKLAHTIRERLATAGSLLLLIYTLGCGGTSDKPAQAAVSGTVTFDGKPLLAGTIRFVPVDGTKGSKVSAQIIDGKFELQAELGPVVGDHRIEVEAPPAGELAMDDEAAFEELVRKRKRKRAKFVRIPKAYNSHSKLKSTIKSDSPNELQLILTSSEN